MQYRNRLVHSGLEALALLGTAHAPVPAPVPHPELTLLSLQARPVFTSVGAVQFVVPRVKATGLRGVGSKPQVDTNTWVGGVFPRTVI